MRLLLDTRIWLWSLLDPERLTRRVVGALSSERNELWLSPISLWELLVLVDRGRVELTLDADAWIEEALARAPMKEAPISHDIARETRRVELRHQDPADRFLAATARALDLTLVTADERLIGCKGLRTLANR